MQNIDPIPLPGETSDPSLRKIAALGDTHIAFATSGTGEPVLMLHCGFVGDSFVPMMQEPALASYYLVNYHRRGYGGSDPVQPPFSLEQQARDAVALLDYLGLARAHVAGHSLGALIAMQLAVDAPQRVHTLALLEPPLVFAMSPESTNAILGAIGQAMAAFMAGDVARGADIWLDGAFGPGWQEIVERSVPGGYAQVVRDGAAAMGVEAGATQQWAFGPGDLKRIEQPVLAVYHHDTRFALFDEVQDLLMRSLPDVEGVQVPDASHLLEMQNPAFVAAALSSFFGRHPM